MKISSSFCRRYRWINLPTATLLALLQRTPLVQVAEIADDMVKASPVGTVLRSAAAAAATLGALNSLAGATTLVSSPLTSPVSATVGTAISATAITVSGTQSEPGSWTVTTAIPPGLSFSNSASATLTGAGNIDVPNGILFLSGTPTTAGTYNVGLIAYEFAGESGVQSPTYTFTIVVSASAAAPSFTTSPASQTVNAGTSVTFTAAASGTPTPTYQWQKNGSSISGATSASYTISSPATTDSGSYTVVATNSGGSTTSAAATLTVVSPSAAPVFTSQPIAQPTVSQGVTLNFNATAVGGSVSYQWEFGTGGNVPNGTGSDGNTYSGATTATLTVVAQAGAVYKVVATNGNGSTTSSSVTMTVASSSGDPLFTTQPESQTVTVGQNVTFTSVATNAATYQWYLGSNAISGAGNATYSISNVQLSASGNYYVVATSASSMDIYGDTIPGNSTNSSIATLTVNSPVTTVAPAFTVNAVSQTVATGHSASFYAVASGTPAPTYQWKLNGSTTIPGATVTTDPILWVSGTTSADAGTYVCTASNSAGTATSTATLMVTTTTTPGYLTNLSGRGQVGVGAANALTGGFGIAGTGSKELLIRGIGPGLNTAFGLTGELTATSMTLNNSSRVVIDQNQTWGGTPALMNVEAAVGAFSVPANSLDSMLYDSEASGGYTAAVTGPGNVTGLALVEIYDADANPPAARLDNLSVRAPVGTGSNILIGGFVIGGSTAETVLIRAMGPSLNTVFGLTGELAQPVLTIYNSSNAAIYSNTIWGGDPVLAAAEAQVGAYSVPNSSQDSMLLVTLPAGGYSAQIAGVNGTTGIAAVEIYEVY